MATNNDNNGSNFGVVKKIFHNKEITEYNSNNNLISELESLKSKVNALKTTVSECSNNLLTIYNQASEAIIDSEISVSFEKINDYNKKLKQVEENLDQAISDINTKIKDLQSRNSYLLGIIYG